MSEKNSAEFRSKRAQVLNDLLKYFFENANYPNAEEFRLEHEAALPYEIFRWLEGKGLIRYIHDSQYAVHLGLYIQTDYWHRDRAVLDKLLPIMQSLHRNPATRGKLQSLDALLREGSALEPLARDRALLLLNELGLIAGQPLEGNHVRYQSIQIREEILHYKKIQEKIDHDVRSSYHNLILPTSGTNSHESWQELLGVAGPSSGVSKDGDAGPSTTQVAEMPAEDRRNSGLILLMLLAQAYYKMLECAISNASWCTALDMELNQSYLWTVTSLTNLLKNHPDLKDFPDKFEPLFPDLYPSTIGDSEWQDMVAPDAESFLSTVQKYVTTKGIYDAEQGSPGWIFVELYRPAVSTAIERALAYNKKMLQHTRAVLGSEPQDKSQVPAGKAQPSPKPTPPDAGGSGQPLMRDKVFISYSHADKKFLDELLAHLKPLERAGRVSAWSDRQIQPGSQWQGEIKKALTSTKVAVLLVTKDFLASDFIHLNELGPLLKSAKEDGVAIRWVLVRDCNWKKTPLKDYQAAFPTEKPLAGKNWSRDSAWVAICDTIEEAANASNGGNEVMRAGDNKEKPTHLPKRKPTILIVESRKQGRAKRKLVKKIKPRASR